MFVLRHLILESVYREPYSFWEVVHVNYIIISEHCSLNVFRNKSFKFIITV